MVKVVMKLLRCKKCRIRTPHKPIKSGNKKANLCLMCGDTIRDKIVSREKTRVIDPREDL